MNKTCCVILAAGEGKRMKSSIPKVLSSVLFEPMIGWVINSAITCNLKEICIVTGYRHDLLQQYIDKLEDTLATVIQEERKGTAPEGSG